MYRDDESRALEALVYAVMIGVVLQFSLQIILVP